MPWGAGARENITIEFTNDVLIQGKKINAGKYGLFMLPVRMLFKLCFQNNMNLGVKHILLKMKLC